MKTRDVKRMYVYVGLAGIAVIVLGTIGALIPIQYVWQKSFSIVGAPVHTLVTNVRELYLFREKKILSEEVTRLSQETRELQSLKAKVSILERENQAIRNALGWAEEKGRKYVVAKVLGHPLHTPRTYLIVNQGMLQGIKVGYPVIIDNDILIGTIVSVQELTSYVRLLTDNESVVSAKLLGGQEPVGVVEGELGLSLRLTLVPKHITPETGEVVVTSGLDEFIPPNVIIGTIDENIQDVDDFFKAVSIRTIYDTNEVNIVSIITSQL